MKEHEQMKSASARAREGRAKKDAGAGISAKPGTDAQKAASVEVRNVDEAKIDELEVLDQSKMNGTVDPGERETLEQQSRREREHLTGERDHQLAKIRR